MKLSSTRAEKQRLRQIHVALNLADSEFASTRHWWISTMCTSKTRPGKINKQRRREHSSLPSFPAEW